MNNKNSFILLQIKYIILAIITGIIIGAIATVFGRGLIAISSFRTTHYVILVPFLPLAGLLITWLYNRFSKNSLKGMSLVFDVGQGKSDSIPLLLVPLVMICTWITHLFGGSAGREGVAVQIGATLSHTIGRKFHLPDNSKILLISGMAAGFGGLFQTPLAATFFAIEVIIIGKMEYKALLPAIISAFTASYTSQILGLEKFSVDIAETISFTNPWHICAIIILGIAFGLTGRLFSCSLKKAKDFMKNKFKNPYIRIGVVSIPLAVCLIFICSGRYCGLGTNLISASFSGDNVLPFDFALKILFTVITLSIGFQGGEVTPLFSIGSSLGIVLGAIFNLPVTVCAALGYAAVFGSATNTLIAPILIGIEVFGPVNAIPFAIVCAIAYIVNGNNSIYSQSHKLITQDD